MKNIKASTMVNVTVKAFNEIPGEFRGPLVLDNEKVFTGHLEMDQK